MLRILIAAILLTAPLIAARANGAPSALEPLEMSQTGAAKAQECRKAATASNGEGEAGRVVKADTASVVTTGMTTQRGT